MTLGYSHMMIEAIAEAGVRGMSLDQLCAQYWAPETRHKLNLRINQLTTQGVVFAACKGAKGQRVGSLLRFFATEAWAKAHQDKFGDQVNFKNKPRTRSANSVIKPNDRAFSEMLFKRRAAEHAVADAKQAAKEKGPARITSETLVTIWPANPGMGNRAYTDPASVPRFKYGAGVAA